MSLRQCVDRAEHISGEIKAARAVLEECASAELEQTRLYDIARAATMRAQERLDALTAERETLAQQAHSAIMAKGEPVPLADESVDAPRVECEVIGVIPPNAPPTIRVDAPGVGVGLVNGGDLNPCQHRDAGPWGESGLLECHDCGVVFGTETAELDTNGIDRAFKEATNP